MCSFTYEHVYILISKIYGKICLSLVQKCKKNVRKYFLLSNINFVNAEENILLSALPSNFWHKFPREGTFNLESIFFNKCVRDRPIQFKDYHQNKRRKYSRNQPSISSTLYERIFFVQTLFSLVTST